MRCSRRAKSIRSRRSARGLRSHDAVDAEALDQGRPGGLLARSRSISSLRNGWAHDGMRPDLSMGAPDGRTLLEPVTPSVLTPLVRPGVLVMAVQLFAASRASARCSVKPSQSAPGEEDPVGHRGGLQSRGNKAAVRFIRPDIVRVQPESTTLVKRRTAIATGSGDAIDCRTVGRKRHRWH